MNGFLDFINKNRGSLQSLSPQDSRKLIFNFSSYVSNCWLYKPVQYPIHLSRTLYLSVRSCPLSLSIPTGRVFFVFVTVYIALNACFISPFDGRILSTSLQCFVINCSFSSFICLLTLLFSYTYSSADHLTLNHLGVLYFL